MTEIIHKFYSSEGVLGLRKGAGGWEVVNLDTGQVMSPPSRFQAAVKFALERSCVMPS